MVLNKSHGSHFLPNTTEAPAYFNPLTNCVIYHNNGSRYHIEWWTIKQIFHNKIKTLRGIQKRTTNK